MIKVIKTQADYETALAQIERLIESDPPSGSREAEQLELLALLVEDYEENHFQLAAPSPLEAIRFRMEQQGLVNKDLIPFIGSRSKVSEVLSGRRPLSLAMIRALHTGLGIPAHVLVREETSTDEEDIDWSRFPVADMVQRGWLKLAEGKREEFADAEALVKDFFRPFGSPERFVVLFRRGAHIRSGRTMDAYALAAWTARIMRKAANQKNLKPYQPASVTPDLLVTLARLSPFEDGPLRARNLLADFGIALVVESHLPRTHLDGAAIKLDNGTPVIGLTIRFDRVDHFWFCLLHELAHVQLHLGASDDTATDFFDDLEVGPGSDPREIEADQLAGECLIPIAEWQASAASKVRAVPAVVQLAHKLHIHPAIVAGRMRHQHKDFRVLGSLVGQGDVRRLFPEVVWP